MSDRVFATLWLGVCATIAWQMWRLVVPFAYEPVGPKAFPLLLAGLMTICCVVLMFRPDHDIHWPEPALLRKGLMLIAILFAYGTLFEWLGFPLATTLMVLGVSRIFGASWVGGAITGISVGGVGYVLFDRLLEVSLPLGRLWGH